MGDKHSDVTIKLLQVRATSIHLMYSGSACSYCCQVSLCC
jgi:hypothetical protein